MGVLLATLWQIIVGIATVVAILVAIAIPIAAALFLFGGKVWRERVAHVVFIVGALVVVLAIAAIFLFVGSQAFQTFTSSHITLAQFFTGAHWSPDEGAAGAFILITGTLVITVLAVLISTPISIAVAIFVTEIAPPWARQFMQPVLELFTGIPSIIYGFLGLQLLVPLVRSTYNTIAGGYFTAGYGVIAAAIVLSIMILPTITSLSIDALAAIPNGLREASLAVGATRWQTITRTLVPAAISGIFTGVILGTGRAIGETLAVALVVGGNANSFPLQFVTYYPYVIFNPTSTITVQLLFDFKEATPGTLTYNAIWTLAFVLLVISLLLVATGRYVASRGTLRTQQSPATWRTAVSRLGNLPIIADLLARSAAR